MRPDTAADRRDFLESGLSPVRCACGNSVLVKKNSRQHTSIQWTSDTVRSCPEFARRVADGAVAAQLDGCARLRDSIEQAVRDGALEVADSRD